MSIGIRGFVEYLIKDIKDTGLLGEGYSENEREEDLINIVWRCYEKF